MGKFQFVGQARRPIRYELQHKPVGDPLDHSCGICFKFQFSALFSFAFVGAGVPDGPRSRHCEFAAIQCETAYFTAGTSGRPSPTMRNTI